MFEGCEAVIHLAFVVQEIHDKELTHSINLGGSKNVIAAAEEAGVREARDRFAASPPTGIHHDHPRPLTEDEFPRGNPDKYYFYDKAEVEHYIEWWERRQPEDAGLVDHAHPAAVHRRPALLEPGVDRFCAPATVLPADAGFGLQLLWEDDLAGAFHLAAKRDAPGPFNVGTDDWISARGVRRVARPAARQAFR